MKLTARMYLTPNGDSCHVEVGTMFKIIAVDRNEGLITIETDEEYIVKGNEKRLLKLRIKELEDFIRKNIVDAMFIPKTRLIELAKEILENEGS